MRQYLPASAILVGQNVGKDVEWLKLKEGADFKVGLSSGFAPSCSALQG